MVPVCRGPLNFLVWLIASVERAQVQLAGFKALSCGNLQWFCFSGRVSGVRSLRHIFSIGFEVSAAR